MPEKFTSRKFWVSIVGLAIVIFGYVQSAGADYGVPADVARYFGLALGVSLTIYGYLKAEGAVDAQRAALTPAQLNSIYGQGSAELHALPGLGVYDPSDAPAEPAAQPVPDDHSLDKADEGGGAPIMGGG